MYVFCWIFISNLRQYFSMYACLLVKWCSRFTCNSPYRSSMSRKEYSFACAGRCIWPGCMCDAPVLGGPVWTVLHDSCVRTNSNDIISIYVHCLPHPFSTQIRLTTWITWYASIFAKLANTGSVANANVSEHSSTGWIIWRI